MIILRQPAEANFYAGREDAIPRWLPRPLRVLRRRAMTDATVEVLDRLQVSLPERSAVVGLMSGGQRQAIAVPGPLRSRRSSSSSTNRPRRSECASHAVSST